MAAKKKTQEDVLIQNYLAQARKSMREQFAQELKAAVNTEAKWNKGYQEALGQLVEEITGITERLNEE